MSEENTVLEGEVIVEEAVAAPRFARIKSILKKVEPYTPVIGIVTAIAVGAGGVAIINRLEKNEQARAATELPEAAPVETILED